MTAGSLDGPLAGEPEDTAAGAPARVEIRTLPLVRDRNLQVVFAVSLMAVLAVPSITPAFPRLARTLGVSEAQIGLLITAFTLPAVIMAPFLGIASDRLGRKPVLIPSLFVFALAGTACAFTRSFSTLLWLRAAQGVGGAALPSLSVTLVGDLFDGRKRAHAMGLNGSVISIGAAAYPALGGVMAAVSIYAPFALAALALPVGFLVLTRLEDTKCARSGGLLPQLRGILGCVLTRHAFGYFIAGVLSMVLFYGTYLTYFTLLMDERFSASPAVIGLVTSVMPVAFALASSQQGRLSGRVRTPNIIGCAFAVYAAAVVLVPFLPAAWMLVFPAALFGLGHGINIPAQQVGMVGLAPHEHRAAFMSMNTAIIRGGQTAGPLLVGVFYLLGGMTVAFLASAALAVTVSAVTLSIERLRGAST